jgi:hypothetical protein
MKAYGARYLGDLRAFTKAYLLALVAILPLVLLNTGALGIFVYLYLALFGGLNIVAFAGLAAVFQNYGYKLLILLLAVAANAYLLGDIFASQTTFPGFTTLLFSQVVFLLGLFYILLERGRIGSWIRRYAEADR